MAAVYVDEGHHDLSFTRISILKNNSNTQFNIFQVNYVTVSGNINSFYFLRKNYVFYTFLYHINLQFIKSPSFLIISSYCLTDSLNESMGG